MNGYEIHLLGTFQCQYDGQPLTKLPTGRIQVLWIRLLLSMDTPLSRRELAFDFWPDSTDEQALSNLRKLIHGLRKILPGDSHKHLVAQQESVVWRSLECCHVDALEFQRLASSDVLRDLDEALLVYRGSLLPGEHSDVVVHERDRLQRLYCHVLSQLADRAEQRRQFDVALDYGYRILREDALSDENHMRIMRLHILKGNLGAARGQLKEMELIFEEELGASPSREVYDLFRDTHEWSYALADEDSVPLIGREKEWATMINAWNHVTDAGPMLVVLEGQAGIGKTRLAEEFIRFVQTRKATVHVSRCHASSNGPHPYESIIKMLEHIRLDQVNDEMLTELSRLIPEIRGAHPSLPLPAPLDHVSRVDAFYDAVAAVLCSNSPTLIVLDDLQWSDVETLQTLDFLLRNQTSNGLRILATLRTEDQPLPVYIHHFLQTVRASHQFVSIAVEPLSQSESDMLVSEMRNLLTLSPTVVEHIPIYQVSGGNPLLISEVLRALRSDVLRSDYSDTLLTLMKRRLSELPADEQNLVDLLVVYGKQLPQTLLLELFDASEHERLLQIVEHLISKRVLTQLQMGVYDFYHPTMREAASERLGHLKKSILHGKLATSLERMDESHAVPLGEIAYHLEAAGRQADAVSYYAKAAEDAAELYSHETVLTYCAKVIDADNGALRLRALSLSAHARRMLGQWKQSEAEYRSWLRLCGSSVSMKERAIHEMGLGNCLRLQARYDEAIIHLEKALNMFEMLDERQGRAEVHGNLGIIYLYLDDFERCAKHLEQNIELESSTNDTGTFTGIMGNLYYAQDRFDEAEKYFRLQLQIANANGNRTALAKSLTGLALTFIETGNFKAAFYTAEERLEASKSIGDRMGIATSVGLYGRALVKAGYIAEAASCILWALRDGIDVKDARFVLMMLSLLGTVYDEQGHDERSIWALEQSEELAKAIGNKSFQCDTLHYAACFHVRRGYWDQAEHYVQSAMQLEKGLSRSNMNLRLQLLLIECQIHMGKISVEEARHRMTGLMELPRDRIATTLLHLAGWELCHMETSREIAVDAVVRLYQESPVPRYLAWSAKLGTDMNCHQILTPMLPQEVLQVRDTIESMKNEIEEIVHRKS